MNYVTPLLFSASTLAPASMRKSTQDTRDVSMALMRGVAPPRAGASTLAPAFTRSSMSSRCPAYAAWWRAVQKNWSHTFTSALSQTVMSGFKACISI